MRKRLALSVAVLFGAAGCATGGGPKITAESLDPCGVATPENEDWRQVEAEEISFCVPASWTPMGKRGWRGGTASLTWGFGMPRDELRRTTVVVRAGEMPPTPPPPLQQRRFSEQIGGIPVEVWLTEWPGEFFTGATWQTPRLMHMKGEATTQREADVLLGIYRTLRVAGS